MVGRNRKGVLQHARVVKEERAEAATGAFTRAAAIVEGVLGSN
jgi:hypothetical protein